MTSTSKKLDARLLKGFRDYLPADALPLQAMMGTIQRVFELYGYAPLETPVLEYADILLGKYGKEGDKLMYRFIDHGKREVALRYDQTVPLARAVAMNQDLPLPFKRYAIAQAWRADKPQKGRLREFYQCDADIVGSDETKADAECLAVAHDLLQALGIKKFVLQINHRRVLDALVEMAGVARNQIGGVMHAIDKFPKYGEENFIKDTRDLGLTTEQTESLLKLITIAGKPSDVIQKLKKSLGGNERGLKALEELDSIVGHALALGVSESRLRVDLKIVRGLDYYTGMIVESVIEDLPLFGSVIGGGRYDNLVSDLVGKPMPAVGVSLGLGRLFDALRELKLVPEMTTKTQVMFAVFGSEDARTVESIATELRQKGINTEVYVGDPGKLEKQLKYADKRGIKLVAWHGPEEQKKQVVAVKDLATRKQSAVDLDGAAAAIAERL